MYHASFDPDGISGSSLTTAVSHQEVDGARIALTGDLDRTSASQLTDAVHRVLASGAPRAVVLDLAGIRFLDVGGVRAVAGAWSSCAAAGCRVQLENPSPFVQRVLVSTGEWRASGAVSARAPEQVSKRPSDDDRRTTTVLVPDAETLRMFAAHARKRAGEIEPDDAVMWP
ncbi:STAS domain-containing protein [Cryptosporangium sp. NPDC051539]|uniref:STAS domain-containing protein n=1 Tax=Cryptosporangium sp. NPDC051539 TaxID=3363962 RepID=UPI0037AAA196